MRQGSFYRLLREEATGTLPTGLHRYRVAIAAITGVIALTIANAVIVRGDDPEPTLPERVANLEKKWDSLSTRVDKLESRADGIDKRLDDLKSTIATEQMTSSSLQKTVADLQASVNSLQSSVTSVSNLMTQQGQWNNRVYQRLQTDGSGFNALFFTRLPQVERAVGLKWNAPDNNKPWVGSYQRISSAR